MESFLQTSEGKKLKAQRKHEQITFQNHSDDQRWCPSSRDISCTKEEVWLNWKHEHLNTWILTFLCYSWVHLKTHRLSSMKPWQNKFAPNVSPRHRSSKHGLNQQGVFLEIFPSSFYSSRNASSLLPLSTRSEWHFWKGNIGLKKNNQSFCLENFFEQKLTEMRVSGMSALWMSHTGFLQNLITPASDLGDGVNRLKRGCI